MSAVAKTSAKEAFGAYLAALGAAGIMGAALPAAPALGTLAQFVLAALLILVPLWPVASGDIPLEARACQFPSFSSLLESLVLSGVILFLFHQCLRQGYWQMPQGPWRTFSQPELLLACGKHLLDVVLAEEVFFRGYLQTAWSREDPPMWKDPGIYSQAVSFGVLHVVAFGGQISALDRIGPGLFFGVLRVRGKTIWPAVLAHLLFNLYAFTR